MNSYNLQEILSLSPEKESALAEVFQYYSALPDEEIISVGHDEKKFSMYIEVINGIQIHYCMRATVQGLQGIRCFVYDEYADTEEAFERVFNTYEEALKHFKSLPVRDVVINA